MAGWYSRSMFNFSETANILFKVNVPVVHDNFSPFTSSVILGTENLVHFWHSKISAVTPHHVSICITQMTGYAECSFLC